MIDGLLDDQVGCFAQGQYFHNLFGSAGGCGFKEILKIVLTHQAHLKFDQFVTRVFI